MTVDAPTLFGAGPPTQAPGVMRAEVEATIKALDALGLLDDRHRAVCQLARQLADVVEAGTRSGKAAAAAMAARELRETLAALPEPEETTTDEWDELVAAMRAAEEGHAARSVSTD